MIIADKCPNFTTTYHVHCSYPLAQCPNSFWNVKTLVGAFSGHCETSRSSLTTLFHILLFSVCGSPKRPATTRLNLVRGTAGLQTEEHGPSSEISYNYFQSNINSKYSLQSLEVCKIGFLFPLFSMSYIFCPKFPMSRMMKKPFIKFICNSASYFVFLCKYHF